MECYYACCDIVKKNSYHRNLVFMVGFQQRVTLGPFNHRKRNRYQFIRNQSWFIRWNQLAYICNSQKPLGVFPSNLPLCIHKIYRQKLNNKSNNENVWLPLNWLINIYAAVIQLWLVPYWHFIWTIQFIFPGKTRWNSEHLGSIQWLTL